MKNRWRLVLASLLVVALLALVGCGGGDSKEADSSSTNSTSTSADTSTTADSSDSTATDQAEETDSKSEASTGIPADLVGSWVQVGGGNEYVINADGTGTVEMLETELEVTWEASGDSLSYSTSGGLPNQYTYKLSGDTLTMTDPMGTSLDYARQ
ncbi:MAG: hypothetical protein LBR39_06795 [Coriobacteriales bacterium]|jgi:ABC-type phosphate transport system substrate-binding protein|nr:hypothetical protein [Coriobacteriales bacterium]